MSDGWLRAPLALLAYKPNDPSATLNAILDYCLWNVGNSAAAREIESGEAYAYAKEKNMSFRKCAEHLQLIRGAKILCVIGGNCEPMMTTVNAVTRYLSPESSATKNKFSVSKEWLWRAVYTARGDDGKDEPELRWRDFRFLCALLSKIGARKFDRCGWQELQARAAGWCGKVDMRAGSPEERARRAPLTLTQDQIRITRDELEVNKFFCRFKYRTGGIGNGGESYYSFSTSDRAELAGWIIGKKDRMKAAIAEKRARDMALLAKARTQPEVTPNPPRTLIGNRSL